MITKKRKVANTKVDANKAYSLKEASNLVKEINCTKFDSSVDLHIKLGVDPKKADQAVRGTVSLPHGTGKTKKVLVLCTPDKEAEAKEAGADFAGLDEFIAKIEGGWTDIDVIVATPSVMPKMGKLGKILGPRNLMPNPKTGTVTKCVFGSACCQRLCWCSRNNNLLTFYPCFNTCLYFTVRVYCIKLAPIFNAFMCDSGESL